MQFHGDAFALALLRADQLFRQRHQFIARSAQRHFGLFAAHNLIAQIAVGVGQRLGASPHPHLKAGIEPLERILRAIQRTEVSRHQHRARVAACGLIARPLPHRPDGEMQEARANGFLELELIAGTTANLRQRGTEKRRQRAAGILALGMHQTVRALAQNARHGAQRPIFNHPVGAHHLAFTAQQAHQCRQRVSRAFPIELGLLDGRLGQRIGGMGSNDYCGQGLALWRSLRLAGFT